MKKLLFIYFILSVNSYASQVTTPTVYQNGGQVTAANLNGNFTATTQVVNGRLDNTNADTTNGYHFFQSVATLPVPGNQGSVYYLTTDNSLNFDTGTFFNKSVSINSPTNGGMIYYNSGWNNLSIGTSGFPLTSNGTIPVYAELTTASTVSGASLTSLSSIPSGAGLIPVANVGALAIAPSPRNLTQVYGPATTDGFAVGICKNSGGTETFLSGFMNASATPSGGTDLCNLDGQGTKTSLTCPFYVVKGDYYEWTSANCGTFLGNFTAIGS